MLADFGADVIHVESPETGDFMREVTGAAGQARASRGYDIINRNKRNISLDMRKPEGRDLFHKLVAVSDAVTENFRPYVMDRWGHDWATLHSINPRLIYCRMSGFGQTGTYRQRRAYGMIGEAFSGWAHMNGYADGPSIHSGFSLGDTMDSIWAANAIVMALYWRDAQGGGEGQLIDQGLVEPLFRELEQQIIIYDQTGVSPRRDGTRHEATPYADVCQTKDGRYFSFSAFTQDAIGRLLAALGLESDSRFNEFQSCDEHEEEFHQVAADWFQARTLAQAVEAFESAGAIGAPVMSGEDMCEDPHIKAREMLVSMPDPEGGETPIVMQGIVPKLSETPGKMRNASEPMGARNEEVFCGLLGLSKDDLAALAAAGVV
jgi:crotonobetainyl-CoA:carnitine CoA-transferase CaiB-like acyl-CoA transferase